MTSSILYQDKYIDYHIEFFKAGLNAVILKWLDNNCSESPETINDIIISNINPRMKFNNKNYRLIFDKKYATIIL